MEIYQTFPDEYYEDYGFLNLSVPTLHTILRPTAVMLTDKAIESIEKSNQYVHEAVIFRYLMEIAYEARKLGKKVVVVHPQFCARYV